ncbi:hypothetical protein A9Q95_06180 [Rhodobacterales bacterium 59_46_T64]|nr:hypothetical protein A9Q95_06180 [Rhodobacterales bacterium 59_46_T64]
MRLSSIIVFASAFGVAAGACLVAASFAVTLIEDSSEIGVRDALDDANMAWAEVHADGLQVFLTGTSPSEVLRLSAQTSASAVVDAARVINNIEVTATRKLAAPHFSIEILRNDSGVSLIGLVPASTDREALVKTITTLAGSSGTVTDLLETADYPMPDGWSDALDYAERALKTLPRAKISVDANRVAITAMSDSPAEKRKLETDLRRRLPGDLKLELAISAPRPVITPFTLRFLIDESGARFDACSADTPEAKERILRAAKNAGLKSTPECTIGLGVPSPRWARAAETGIKALTELGGGSLTMADADISLIAAQGTAQAAFDRIVGETEAALPEVFALSATLPPAPNAGDQGPPEFVATRSPEGLVQLRGRVTDEQTRTIADSFAKARFGSAAVYSAARIDDTLPRGWALRVLAGIEALSKLSNGAVTVTPQNITVSGNTGNPTASDEISRLLADKIGEGGDFSINVTYQKQLDPVLGLPTPDECEAEIKDILATRKLNFEPGSATLDASGSAIMQDIAEVLKRCGDEIKMEIGGHTDSQGRESMNLQLSQDRAQAVLNELRSRRLLTSGFTAKGYGETSPVADNDTEDGREANRRIEFRLIRPEPVKPVQTTLEAAEAAADSDAETPTVLPDDEGGDTGSGDEDGPADTAPPEEQSDSN